MSFYTACTHFGQSMPLINNVNQENRTPSQLLTSITTEANIELAYLWLCKQRKDYPANSDVWYFRSRWPDNKRNIVNDLLAGRYTFTPQQRITLQTGKVIHLWCARDALVMRAMATILGPQWPISPRCTHVKGLGGLKGALRWLRRKLPQYQYVFRSDVKGYYENIDQTLLLKQLDQVVPADDVLWLLRQAIKRTVEWGGTFKEISRGIGRGCPLSPLFAALYLKPLDDAMDKAGIAYVRYMDDWVVLVTNRHKLKRAIRLVNETLNALKLTKHPDKTWMGKIDRGCDFLGYHHTRAGCYPAQTTLNRFAAQINRLYEQGASQKRIGAYQISWRRWVCAGLPKGVVLSNYTTGYCSTKVIGDKVIEGLTRSKANCAVAW